MSLDLVHGHRRRRHAMEIRRVEDLLGRLGRRFRCGTDGEVRVPYRARGAGIVAARFGPLFGIAAIDGVLEPEPLVLRVDAGRTLDVRVSDGSGGPAAGAQVSLQVRPWYGYHPFARSAAGADGVARFPHADKLRVLPWRLADWLYFDRWTFPGSEMVLLDELRFTGFEPTSQFREVRLDAEELEPPTLVLAPSGSLRVSMIAPGEKNLPNDLRIAVFPSADHGHPGADVTTAPVNTIDAPSDARCVAVPENGTVVFPHVALGRNLVLEAWIPGAPRSITRRIAGPTRPGQQVSVEMRWDPQFPSVTGTAVDARGRPLGGRQFLAYGTFEEGPTDEQGGLVRTDPGGRFELRLADDHPAVLRLECLDHRFPARAEVRVPATRGSRDLEKVEFSLPPVLATGTVVDAGGRPVPGARVWTRLPGNAVEVGTVADDRGRFTLFDLHNAFASVENLRVASRGGGFARIETEVRNRAEGQRFVLRHRSASWTLPVRAPEGFDPRHLWAWLVRREGDVDDRAPSAVWDPESGALRFHDLDPGRYELIWDWRGPDGSLDLPTHPARVGSGANEVGGVVEAVVEGVAELDLRGLRRVAIEVRDSHGRPVTQVHVSLMRGGDEVGRYRKRSTEGSYELWIHRDVDRVYIGSEGHRSRELRALPDRMRVVLESLLPVRVVLEGVDDLPAGCDLRLDLDGGQRRTHVDRTTRAATLWLDGPYEGELVLTLCRGDAAARVLGWKVEFTEREGTRVLRIQVPAAALGNALWRLR